MYEEMAKATLERSENIKKWEPPAWMSEEGSLQLPPLMQIISGMFAAKQLRFTRGYNWSCVITALVIVSLSVMAFILDYSKTCKDPKVWVWHIGLLSIASVDFIFRAIVVRKCDLCLDFLQEQQKDMDKQAGTGGFMDMMSNLRRRGGNFFDAFFKYNSIKESWPFWITNVISATAMIWGGFGVYITIQDVVPDSLACDARYAVGYMRVYSFIYVILVTWQILLFSLWVLQLLSGSAYVRMPLITAAKNFDDDTMRGMPIFLSLVQSFVLKDSAEVYSLKTRQVLRDIRELEKSIEEAEANLLEKKRARDLIHARNREAPDEAEFMKRCSDRVNKGLEELKPMVGLIASKTQTNPVGPDPTAATSSALPRKSVVRIVGSHGVAHPGESDDPAKSF
jgi:hypothetical protein